MSLLMIESFDAWTGANLGTYHTLWYSTSSFFNSVGGRRGTTCMRPSGGDSYYTQYDLGVEESAMVIGFAVSPASGATASNRFLDILDGSGVTQFVVGCTTAGRVQVKTAPAGSILAESSDGAITFDIYQYFEIKFTVDSSSGTVQVRVNGADVIASTGSLNTQQAGSGGAQKIQWRSLMTTGLNYFDDLYLCNLSGATYNDFLGDVKVDAFVPTADGNYSQFTPSTGSDHYDVINDNGPAADDEYIESSTVGHRDSFEITPTGNLPTIYAIALRSVSYNTDTGVAEGTPFVRMGGIDYDQSAFNRGATVEYDDAILTARPDTGGPWTKTVLLTTEIGWQFSNAS
jgi:hypothetical protein